MELPSIWTCWQPSNTSSGRCAKWRNISYRNECTHTHWVPGLRKKGFSRKKQQQPTFTYIQQTGWKNVHNVDVQTSHVPLETHLDFGCILATVANDCGRIFGTFDVCQTACDRYSSYFSPRPLLLVFANPHHTTHPPFKWFFEWFVACIVIAEDILRP